ncbi:MAG: hypothetical protein K2Y29_07290 [Beijerinckiaceae bacterium]|nr:hypothetical protein [Beijerinckiaceae bacterium]
MARSHAVAAALGVLLAGVQPSAADESAFYKGRQVNLIIAAAVGGGYDLYGRIVARHIGRHIPGSPNVVAQNMLGGGGNTGAGYVYATAPKDGSVIGAATAGVVLDAILLDKARINHDPRKFKWLGSAASDQMVCVVNKDSKATSFSDAFSSEILIGVSGGTTRDYPQMLNKVLGTRFKLIMGYPGTRDVHLAMERKEVDGVCGMSFVSIQSQRPEWLKEDGVRFLVQEGATDEPQLSARKVPLTVDFAKEPEQRQVMEMLYNQNIFLRPFMVAPETPPARVAALRKAFLDALADPLLLAEADKARLAISPKSGEEMERMVEAVFAAPPRVHEKLRESLLN